MATATQPHLTTGVPIMRRISRDEFETDDLQHCTAWLRGIGYTQHPPRSSDEYARMRIGRALCIIFCSGRVACSIEGGQS